MATSERSVLEPRLGPWHSQNLAGVALPVNAGDGWPIGAAGEAAGGGI
jgi:hypothetical protein